MLDIIKSVRHHNQVLTTSDARDIEVTVVVKLQGQNIDTYFYYTKLNLNRYDNNFEEQLNDINNKKTGKIT